MIISTFNITYGKDKTETFLKDFKWRIHNNDYESPNEPLDLFMFIASGRGVVMNKDRKAISECLKNVYDLINDTYDEYETSNLTMFNFLSIANELRVMICSGHLLDTIINMIKELPDQEMPKPLMI